MKSANDIVLKLLGLLLLTGAALKGWQLLTEPVANSDIWTNRAFLIFTVEFEIALGIWLLSGIFKQFAWLVTLACFSLFSVITLYKGISGAESCGCFGSVHVNPWITLFVVDIPSILALVIFRQKHESDTRVKLKSVCEGHACGECKCFKTSYFESLAVICKELYKKYATPLPSLPRLATVICVSCIILALSTCILAFNEPAKSTSEYEVLEPETWVGKELPILEHIDIGYQLKKGNWIVLLYHHDCPDCIKAINKYQRYAANLASNGDVLKVAFLEVPPYGENMANNANYKVGKLFNIKDWFITTPAIVLLDDSMVWNFWEEKMPDLDAVLNSFAKLNKSSTSNSDIGGR